MGSASKCKSNPTTSSLSPQEAKRHVVLFPFMSKGHTIPLLHLARLLLRRPDVTVTVFTTAANRPFVETSLAGTEAVVILLPFPGDIPGIPAGVESTENLPSMSLFPSFVTATEAMKPHFDQALASLLPRVAFLVADGFLWWTQDSADQLSISRFTFYGMSNYAAAITRDFAAGTPFHGDNAVVMVPSFPWIKVHAKDISSGFRDPESDPVHSAFLQKAMAATSRSSGVIVNSFRELEAPFADHWDGKIGPKSHYVGPLCMEREESPRRGCAIRQWLDSQSDVVYVAFGSQTDISKEQIGEIARGLEESGVSFLWVVRKREGLEERVRERGVVVREWVEQREILRHKSVRGFVSHCGWNSVMESVCAGVPILAWPLGAEQPLNAKMVAEEIRVGIRVEAARDGLVTWQEVRDLVNELMVGDRGKDSRKNVTELALAARKAVAQDGSSRRALDALINDACRH